MMGSKTYGKWKVEPYLLGLDVLSWSISALIVWIYRTLGDKYLVSDYILSFLGMMVGWLVIGWLIGRYRKITRESKFKNRVSWLFLSLVLYATLLSIMMARFSELAADVFFVAMIMVGVFC